VFLDKFKLDNLTLQLQYATAYEVWDKAGATAREMLRIWPDLELLDGNPLQQTLKSSRVTIQTGVKGSAATLSGLGTIDHRTIERLVASFKAWRGALSLEQLTRISTRGIYYWEFDSLEEATAAMRALNLVRLPNGKVFDQPEAGKKNTLEIAYRFEDEKSFSFFRLKSEEVKYELKLDFPFEDRNSTKTISRLSLDFDRGLLGSIDATKFMMDEWLKGFQHVLRRDIDKIVGAAQ
jgi:hypothetical protein